MPRLRRGNTAGLPDGFEFTAWRNESCPTWHEGDSLHEPRAGEMMLAIDYADDGQRECPDGQRFNLHVYDAAGSPDPILSSDDWAAIETAVAYLLYVRALGRGFHVDTRGQDYASGDGTRVSTDDEATDTTASWTRCTASLTPTSWLSPSGTARLISDAEYEETRS